MNELHKIVDELVTWKPQGSIHKRGSVGNGYTEDKILIFDL